MTPKAEEKWRQALAHIERAQVELGEACSALSPVVGLVKEWERVGELYDKVQAEWHRLNRLDGPFRLDSEPKARAAIALATPEKTERGGDNE